MFVLIVAIVSGSTVTGMSLPYRSHSSRNDKISTNTASFIMIMCFPREVSNDMRHRFA